MKINELTETEDMGFDFDVVDDAIVFMKNDPMFYRKQYYPAMTKIADAHRAGKNVDQRKILSPVVEKGIADYCRKFKLASQPDEVFNQNDREAIIDRIFSEEMEQIDKGDYA
jgi:hypothetical protein